LQNFPSININVQDLARFVTMGANDDLNQNTYKNDDLDD